MACNFSSLIWPAGSAPAPLRLLFDPPEPQIIGKTQSRLSYLFAHLHLLSSDSFSSTLLSSNLSLLSASALLCFSSVHIVGSLASQLPSINLKRNLVLASPRTLLARRRVTFGTSTVLIWHVDGSFWHVDGSHLACRRSFWHVDGTDVRPSVAWCFSVARPSFWRLAKHRQTQAEGLVRSSVAWCFSVAGPRFWRCESCNLELVSCRLKKQP